MAPITTPFGRYSTASDPLLKGISGRYFEDCNEAAIVTNGNSYMSGVAPYALNPDNAERLWEESLRLLASSGFPQQEIQE